MIMLNLTKFQDNLFKDLRDLKSFNDLFFDFERLGRLMKNFDEISKDLEKKLNSIFLWFKKKEEDFQEIRR